ncbi:M4 family metallopeptidase [Micromonospora sp. CA-111912]|uniref:M4 family metallopeptidase n=1 Tax=Micromonospora sp. CA-111912 TaxID=3239955 RepID=UPI003D89C705
MNQKNALAVIAAVAITLSTVGVANAALPSRARSATPSVGGFRPLGVQDRSDALAAAAQETTAVAKVLGLGPKERLVAKDVLVDDNGARHVRYDRTYDGLPIVGGDLVVHRSVGNQVAGVTWAHEGTIKINGATSPRLSVEDASARARRGAKHVRSPRTTKQDSSQLVVWAVGKVAVLAYRSTVTGAGEVGANSREAVVVDASSGAVLDQYEVHQPVSGTGNGIHVGQVTLETTQNSSGYTLTDALRGSTIVYDSYGSSESTPSQNARAFTKSSNSWGNSTTSSRESAAVDVSYGLAKTWDYYKATFNRNGIRNDGRGAPAYVHVGTNLVNAFYDDTCFCMAFGDGSSQNSNTPLTSLDVAGHELSHGVTAATANLNYSGESGGLNEATSDIFGSMVEFYAANTADPADYHIGEKLNVSSNGYMRRMDNPAADGNSLSCYSSQASTADVHYSSGIGNHFFYLAAEGTGAKTIGGLAHNGTTCNNDTFAGIGRSKAEAIWYRALATYMTSTTNYSAARTATLSAAADLYGTGSQERYIVSRAWAAVSVGTVLPTPTGSPSPSQSSSASPTPSSSASPTPSSSASPTATSSPPTGSALVNGSFEQGTLGWTQSANDITNSTLAPARSGSWYAWMLGYGSSAAESLSQSNIAVPNTASPKLTFWLRVSTQESGAIAYDTLKVKINGTTLATYSNANASAAYVQKTIGLSAYRGKAVSLEIAGLEDAYLSTIFLIDDVSIS